MKLKLIAVSLLLAVGAMAQTFGVFSASQYAYGINPAVPALIVSSGNTATGSQTVTLSTATVTLQNGQTIMPLSTNAPITFGSGSTQETVTPTAVSGCVANGAYGSCQVTASFTYDHGRGTPISSGTAGLQEAIDAANSAGGGLVLVDQNWVKYGGTSTMITSTATAETGVSLEDLRSTGPVFYNKSGSNYASVLTVGATNVTGASIPVATSCGSSATCATPTSVTNAKVVVGTIAFSAATTATVSGIAPAFTATADYTCSATDPSNAYTWTIKNVSASSFTITAGTSNSDTWSYSCVGF